MKKYVLALPVVLLLGASEKNKKDTTKEMEKFAGTWVAVAQEANGIASDKAVVKN